MASENVFLFKQIGKDNWDMRKVPRRAKETYDNKAKLGKKSKQQILDINQVGTIIGHGFSFLKPGEKAKFAGKEFTGDPDRTQEKY